LICPNGECNVSNPDGAHFCSTCGWPLAGLIQPWIKHIEKHVDDAISQQKVDISKLEYDVRQKAIDHLVKWIAISGGVFSAAATIALVGFSIWGYKNISEAQDIADKIKGEVSIVRDELRTAKGDLSTTQSDIDSLQDEVIKAERGFRDQKRFAPNTYYVIKIDKFKKYLETLGLTLRSSRDPSMSGTDEILEFRIPTFLAGGLETTNQSNQPFFDPDSDFPLKYYAVIALLKVANIGNEIQKQLMDEAFGRPDANTDGHDSAEMLGLIEGLSLYLACSYNGVGEFRYRAQEYSIIHKKFNGKISDMSKLEPGVAQLQRAEFWGKLFWEIREFEVSSGQNGAGIGQLEGITIQKTDILLAEVWKSVTKNDETKEIVGEFIDKLRRADYDVENQQTYVHEILTRVGF